LNLGVSRNRFCDFLADPDSRSFSRFGAIIMQFAVRKRVCVFAPCLLTSKMIILPRQARDKHRMDKHRENSQRERHFLIDVMAIKRAREDLAREQVRTRNLFLLTHSSCTKVENDQFCQARLGTNARTSVETIMTESVRFSRPIGRSC